MSDSISPNPPLLPVGGLSEADPVDPVRESVPTQALAEVTDAIIAMDIEQWDLPMATRQEIQVARFQYHLAYVVMAAMNTLPDPVSAPEDMSVPDTSDTIQEVGASSRTSSTADSTSSDHSLSGRPPSGYTPSGHTVSAPPAAPHEHVDRGGRAGETRIEDLLALLEGFAPERIARKVLDVAVSLFLASGLRDDAEGPEMARRRFVETIGQAIDEGFRQVHRKWGTLPPVVQEGFEKTHTLIFNDLQTFIDKGIEGGTIPQEGDALAQMVSFFRDSARCFEQLEKASAKGCYNTQGVVQPASPGTFSRTG